MPKVGAKTIAASFNFLSLIPNLVKLVELFHGGGNGAQKRDAVIGMASSILAGAGAAAAANNPAYKDAIGGVVDATVASLNASGQMPTP